MEKRRRPKLQPSAEACTVFIDECGQHNVGSFDQFPVFVLTATIIRDIDFEIVDGEWRRWKHDFLGSEDTIVHEPDVRRNNIPFRGPDGEAAVAALPAILNKLDFAVVTVVVHRDNYVSDYGCAPIDASLPGPAYMMALDFLAERLLFVLEAQFAGAKAKLVAESRGGKEDALLQHEFSRLLLDGTSYIPPSWFRQQLHVGIEFLTKRNNNTGLQLADLLARPIGEKVAAPDTDPPRWSVVREKLCGGQETKNSILGLKIVPWRSEYEGLWKS